MHIVIINITRFGDTLQTQPLIHALKSQGHSLAWIGLSHFISAAELLDEIDAIFPLPVGKILAPLQENNGEKWHNSLKTLEDYIGDLHNNYKPDAIINLTATNTARLLAKRLSFYNGKNLPIYGFGMDEHGFMHNSTVWANYIHAVTLHRISSPYNISDAFSILGNADLKNKNSHNPLIRKPDDSMLKQAADLLYSLELINYFYEFSPKGYIGLQLGASTQKRQWAVEEFANLSQYIIEMGYVPVLLGTKEEENLGEQFYLAGGMAKNAIGKTSLPLLGAMLRQCKALVTNDTGTMHLAAAHNVPIIGIFLATAQPWDTGPVSLDACLIEPNLSCHPCNFSTICPYDYKCRKIIPAKVVADLLEKKLESNVWGQYFSEFTRIWKNVRDEDGFLTLRPLDILEHNTRAALYIMQRKVYSELLRLLEAKDNQEPHAHISALDAIDIDEKNILIQTIDSLSDLFFLLIQQSKLLHKLPKMKQNFLSTNQKIILILKESRNFVPLAYMWEYGMEAFGSDIEEFNKFISIVQEVTSKWKAALINQ